MATKQSKHKVTELDQILGLATGKDTTATDAQKNALKQNLGVADLELQVGNKADANGMYHGLTSGIAENLMPRFGSEYATKEVIGLGGRKSGGTNKIDGDVFAKIDCIKGYTLMWRQMIPAEGTSAENPVTIGGTYTYGGTQNRPYLMYNPTDEAVVIGGVSVPSKQWSVQRIETETKLTDLAAGWKCIDLLLTFGVELGHTLGTTDKVAKAMGYVATTAKTAFEVWEDTEQFTTDMTYSAETVIRNGRWNGLKSTGKDGDGKDIDFTRSIEQIRKSIFPDGMNGINIGTANEVCDTIEAGRVVKRVVKCVYNGTESWKKSNWWGSTPTMAIKNDDVAKKYEDKNMENILCNVLTVSAKDTTSGKSDKSITQNYGYLWTYDSRYTDVSSWKAHLAELAAAGTPLTVFTEIKEDVITPITELNITYPVSNTEGTETPVCEPSTNCSPLAANITYGLDAYATIVDLKKRVEALEKK